MYDTLSLIFVSLFAVFYLVLFAALLFWILKPWLLPASRAGLESVVRRVRRIAGLFEQRSRVAAGDEAPDAGAITDVRNAISNRLRRFSNSVLRSVFLLSVLVVAACLAACQVAQASSKNGGEAWSSIEGQVKVVSPDGRLAILPGVTLRLVAVSPTPENIAEGAENRVRIRQQQGVPAASAITARTNAQGHYAFLQLRPATYRLQVAPAGFSPFSKTIALAAGELHLANIELRLASMIQAVKVRAQSPAAGQQSVTLPTRISQGQILDLPLAQQKFTEALPLVPGVVRTPDGQLNMKGSPETNGMLLLDSAQLVDPVTGSFAIGVPADAIQAVTVNTTPYSTEYGGFSGGLTTVETKPPSDRWRYDLLDFIPGIRGKAGHIVGVADWIPRLTFGGPLIHDKLNFSESFAYEKRNQPVRGLAWPHNEIQTQGVNSFTSLQAILSPRHLLVMNVDVFPLRTQFANINSLVPQTASSNYGQKGVSAGATDNYQFNSGGLLSTVFRYTRFDSNSYGQGPLDMLITPEGWGGNFFNAWTRTADQLELFPTFELPEKRWHGSHELRVGTDLTYRSYGSKSASHPIDLLRQDGSLAEKIDFEGQGVLASRETEVSEFVQDHWMMNERLAFDLGARLTSQEEGRPAAFAPRGGVVISPDRSQKTIIRAGAGLFYDQVSLLASDFNENLSQVVTPYTNTGLPAGAPQVFANECIQPAQPIRLISSTCNFGLSPRNFTWNVEVERQLKRSLFLRVGYLHSQTQDLFIVNPSLSPTEARAVLGLSPTGASNYDDFEVTLHYQPGEFSQLNVSYVHSRARGNLNTLSSVFVPFEEPVIRPDAVANLNSDIPDRLITWGEFSLPWHLVFSPVVDVHTGFPYSNLNVLQNYVGEPNGERFPGFFSLDVRVYREVRLPVPFISKLKNHKFRLGLYSINVTNHSNPRDVFYNVASPYFGRFVGLQHRVDGLVIDLVN